MTQAIYNTSCMTDGFFTGLSCGSYCLTRLRVDPAGVEEVGGKVDIHVAEEKQHVAPSPGPRSNVKAPPARERLVQLKQRVVLKINFPADKERIIRKQRELIQTVEEIQR